MVNETDSIAVLGKFFRAGEEKWFPKAIDYDLQGPADLRKRGLETIARSGFNTIRCRELPDDDTLDEIINAGLRVLIVMPWEQDHDFLHTSLTPLPDLKKHLQEQAPRLEKHPATLGLVIADEIQPELLRWLEKGRVESTLSRLMELTAEVAPGLPLSYGNSREALHLPEEDFRTVSFPLTDRETFRADLEKAAMDAGEAPLLIQGHVEEASSDVCAWFLEETAHSPAAGFVLRGRLPKAPLSAQIEGWDEIRLPRKSAPAITAVVCTRHGHPLLPRCLESLTHQSHLNCEVLLINDGNDPEINLLATHFPDVRVIPQDERGLSAAMNLGLERASHELVAFTTDYCVPDEDWLVLLSQKLASTDATAVRGPGLPPPITDPEEIWIRHAPARPQLEEGTLTGFNMALRRSAGSLMNGFHEGFTGPGGDVDFGWRLEQNGQRIDSCSDAFVWYDPYRTKKEWGDFQRDLGRAEGLLSKRHPEKIHRFAPVGYPGPKVNPEDLPLPLQNGQFTRKLRRLAATANRIRRRIRLIQSWKLPRVKSRDTESGPRMGFGSDQGLPGIRLLDALERDDRVWRSSGGNRWDLHAALNPWTVAHVRTVTEQHEEGKTAVRCFISFEDSIQGRLGLGLIGLLPIVAIVGGLLAHWGWMIAAVAGLIALLPVAIESLSARQRYLKDIVEAARLLGMKRIL